MSKAEHIGSAYIAIHYTLDETWGPLTEQQAIALSGASGNLAIAYEKITGRKIAEVFNDAT